MIDSIYCINLDESTDRWKGIQEEEKKIGRRIQRVKAIHYRDVERKDVADERCQIFCTDSMLGIFTSHKKVWKTIVENDDKASIILEDDCTLSTDTVEYTEAAIKEMDSNHIEWDVLYLGNLFDQKDTFLTTMIMRLGFLGMKKSDPCEMLKYVYKPKIVLSTHAYVVSNKGAKKLLALFQKIPQAVDVALVQNEDYINQYATKEPLAWQNNSKTTQVQGEYPTLLNGMNSTRRLSAVLYNIGGIVVTGFLLMSIMFVTIVPVSWETNVLILMSLVFLYEYIVAGAKQKQLIYIHWLILVTILVLKRKLHHNQK